MKFKKLEWTKLDSWIAKTPASPSGFISIGYEDNRFWPLWNCDQKGIAGFESLEEAMTNGQEYHEKFLKQYLE
jgi:hypothetical protein